MINSLLTENNRTKIMLALEEIIREEHAQLRPYILDIRNFWNPLKCREDLIAFLAKQLGVTNWDDTWLIDQKRKVCLNAILVNKHKGTIGALKRALSSLNLSTEVIEWFNEKDGKPGTAKVILHEQDTIYNEAQYKIIYELISEVKRLSVYITLSKVSAIRAVYYCGLAFNNFKKTKVAPNKFFSIGKYNLAIRLKDIVKRKIANGK